jgi:hypothetical protein
MFGDKKSVRVVVFFVCQKAGKLRGKENRWASGNTL